MGGQLSCRWGQLSGGVGGGQLSGGVGGDS